jgi:hypothetical protein
MTLTSEKRRKLENKRLPYGINRYGRAWKKGIRESGYVKTISEEVILAFRKPGFVQCNQKKFT